MTKTISIIGIVSENRGIFINAQFIGQFVLLEYGQKQTVSKTAAMSDIRGTRNGKARESGYAYRILKQNQKSLKVASSKFYRNKICSLTRISKKQYFFGYFQANINNMKKLA